MHDNGYKAVLTAILLTHEPKEKKRCVELLDYLREIFEFSIAKHESLLKESLDYRIFVLEASADLPPNQNLVLNIFNEESFRQHTINHGETYRFDLGQHRNFRLKFAVARFNGEKRKAVVRSSSFIKRMMMLDKKDGECLQLNSFPLNAVEKCRVCNKGHCYTAELKIVQETRDENVPQLSFEDLVDLTRGLHEWQTQMNSQGGEYDGELDDQSFALLQAVVNYHQIPSIVTKIAKLCVFLVWDPSMRSVDDSAITRLIGQIRIQHDSEHPLLVDALSYLSECVSGEMAEILRRFEDQSFFPPEGHLPLKKINLALKTVVDICVLPLWDRNGAADPSPLLAKLLAKMVHKSATKWVTVEFQPDTKDIRETCLMIQSMWEKVQHHYQSSVLFFHQFNINFFHITFSTIDEKLEESCRDYLSSRLSSLDSRSPDELEIFSKCTMRFYETLAAMARFSLQHRVKNLRLHNFEDWFLGIPVYWTYSWRQLSQKMISRTVTLSDDVFEEQEQRRPVPAALYSFLCIQKGLSDDYLQLALSRPENIIMGTVALVHILSENTCSYGLKLSSETGGDLRRIVRAVNGVEQSFDYMEERWEKLVDWEEKKKFLSEDEQQRIQEAVLGILKSIKQRCDAIIGALLGVYLRLRNEDSSRIAKLICLTSAEYAKTIMSYMRDLGPHERVHETLDAVDKYLEELRPLFMPRTWRKLCNLLFDRLEEEVEKQLKQCQHHDYYSAVYITVKAVMDMLEIEPSRSKMSFSLHLRSFSTEELLLSFYGRVAELAETATDCPQLTVQMACVPVSGANVILVVNVVEACLLQSLNPLCDRMDPYVKLELVPRILFPEECFPTQKTKPQLQTSRPVWTQTFQFLIPEQLFFRHGATLRASLLDHDRFCDQLLGRAFVSLPKVARAEGSRRLPPSISLPLVQPSIGNKIPYFQMLKERVTYDRQARQFVVRENRAREMYMKVRRLSHKVKSKCL